MTEGKISKSLFLFALPIMGGLVLQMLYNTVDGIVVGNFVGEQALAAVNTSGSFANLLIAIASGISGGSGVYLSQLYGAQEKEKLHRAMGTLIILMIGMGIGFTILGELTSTVVLKSILCVPADTYNDGLLYLRIYLIGLAMTFLYNAFAAALRSIGDSKAAMYMLVIASGINIVLDLVFVMKLELGVIGVSVATVIAQTVSVICSLVYMKKKRPLLSVPIKEMTFSWEICKIYLKTGTPMAFQFAVGNLGTIVIQRLVNSFGSSFMAACAAAGKVEHYAVVPIMSFAQSMSVFAGQNVGAGKLNRVKQGLVRAYGMALIGCVIISIIMWGFARPLIGFFGLSGQTLEYGVEYVYFMPCILMFAVFLYITRTTLQGTGDVTVPMIYTFVTLGIRVAAAYIMAATPIGYRACWMATGVDFLAGCILMTTRFASGKWKQKRLVTTKEAVD